MKTIDDFDLQYTPDNSALSDVFDPDDQVGMFETYGKDLDFVLSVVRSDPLRVWTAIDSDNGRIVLVNGFTTVNRVYYIVTVESGSPDECFLIHDDLGGAL